MIAIGSCIGSGIFLTPSMIADHLGDGGLILGVWALGGIIGLAGALSLAYLGMIFPQTGGVYIYLRERYGSWAAFSYGWIILTVVTSGAIAALSMAFARYVDFIIPLGAKGVLILAICGIIVVTLVNLRGVDKADLMSTMFTILKLLGIVIVILIGIYYAMDGVTNEAPLMDKGWRFEFVEGHGWSYDWHYLELWRLAPCFLCRW